MLKITRLFYMLASEKIVYNNKIVRFDINSSKKLIKKPKKLVKLKKTIKK